MRAALAAVVTLALASCASSRPRAGGDASSLVLAIADEYVARYFERHPEEATQSDWPEANHGAVTDPSLEALARWQAYEDAVSRRLHGIDGAGLDERARWTRAIVLEEVDGSRQLRACRRELWGVRTTVTSWQSQAVSVATVQPVGTPELRAAHVARLRGLAGTIDARIANLREGLRLGYVATRENVDAVVRQVDALAATAPGESPFGRPTRQDRDPAFRDETERVIAGKLTPALRRYREFLATEYAPHAAASPGVRAFPDGAACYAAAVRRFVTLEVPAEEIHRVGLRELARIRAEMERVAERALGTRDVGGVLERLRTDPAHQYGSSEEIVVAARSAVDRAWAAAPRWFSRLPAARLRVEPYQEFRRSSAPIDSYAEPTGAGGGEGVFWVNAFVPPSRSRSELESVTFHESVPGHHLQIALAKETADVPVARWLWNSAYGEGWALYAERLADEMGLYSSDVDRMGMLSSEALRAARLVVDSGIHAFGWSHDQAVQFLLRNTTLGRDVAVSEVNRYAATPGQAVSYMLGAVEIRRLRGEAERALGSRFDVRAFHHVVLSAGTLPLGVLRERVEAWVRAGGGNG